MYESDGLMLHQQLGNPGVIDGKIKQQKIKSRDSQNTQQHLNPHLWPLVFLLVLCYLTGDSVWDKCVEMLLAASKADDDYYRFNCDKMASEIEDHIYQELKGMDMKYWNWVQS
ncbi:hypothetical protein GH733_009925 [Mirounga leonina]|nr:hypothetical protein GH733_009925 [Mirounga leonina]